jgi:phenylacetate-coenzyme A ligase PaaK-like adenylate-forming protein
MAQDVDPILDCPIDEVPDPQELIEAAMRWHFSPRTGSAYWLERAKTLGFDPRKDVHTFADLRLFPNVINDMRDVRVEELIPRGYESSAELFGVFESGGTTGAPKRVVCMKDWLARWLAFGTRNMDERGCPRGLNWLVLMPSGPHMAGAGAREQARMRGEIVFTIDMDPRWVKKCIAEGRGQDAESYVDHLIKQAAFVLETQDIGIILTTPPLLERLAEHDRLVTLINKNVRLIQWAGAHMDADTRHLLRNEIFPGAGLHGFYASTMILGGAYERIDLTDDHRCIFDPFSPYLSFAVVDPKTGEEVGYGERGQVVMNHISKGMLAPNNLERDTAVRVRTPAGHVGDSVADVTPVMSFDNELVIEGVY